MTLIFALAFAVVSGALAAALVCKAIRLRLWADVLAGLGTVATMYLSGYLAGANGWPVFGFAAGFASVVAYLRLRQRLS